MHRLIEEFGANAVINTLKPFISLRRQLKIEEIVGTRIHGVHVALEAPSDIHNAYAVVRSSEALGVCNVHIIAPEIEGSSGKRTMQGSHRWVHMNHYRALENFLSQMDGFFLAGASIHGHVMLEAVPTNRPFCILIGNEHRGLSDEALSHCNIVFKIPMFGMVESYNLSVSAAISLYALLHRYRKEMGANGDLTPDEILVETALYYIRSIGFEKAQKFLKSQ